MDKPYLKLLPKKSILLVGHAPVMETLSERLARDQTRGLDSASFELVPSAESIKARFSRFTKNSF